MVEVKLCVRRCLQGLRSSFPSWSERHDVMVSVWPERHRRSPEAKGVLVSSSLPLSIISSPLVPFLPYFLPFSFFLLASLVKFCLWILENIWNLRFSFFSIGFSS